MKRDHPGRVSFAAIISTTLMVTAPALAGENKFVFVPRTDSPGNDLRRVHNSSFEDCARRCEAENDCNTFTYNQRHGACFLKRSANRELAFYAFAITGLKLSPSGLVTAPQSDTENHFVIIPRTDSPGKDYFRITLFTLKDCQRNCEADKKCHAFSYNQARSVCRFKRAANQWIKFYAWATTGVRLSSLQPKTETAPVPAPTTSKEKAEASEQPSAPAEPQIPTPSEQAQPPAYAAGSEGKAIFENNCGRCHSLGASGESPLPQAPPLREVYLKYPIDQLEQGFGEGMGSKHRDMPQIQFSPDQVAAILNYLGSITGVDPATRARAVIPGETPP